MPLMTKSHNFSLHTTPPSIGSLEYEPKFSIWVVLILQLCAWPFGWRPKWTHFCPHIVWQTFWKLSVMIRVFLVRIEHRLQRVFDRISARSGGQRQLHFSCGDMTSKRQISLPLPLAEFGNQQYKLCGGMVLILWKKMVSKYPRCTRQVYDHVRHMPMDMDMFVGHATSSVHWRVRAQR